MITTQKPQLSVSERAEARTATKNVLNCYEILSTFQMIANSLSYAT
jgi:hypothetical protein